MRGVSFKMKKGFRWASIIGVAVLVGLFLASGYIVTTAFAQGMWGPGWGWGGGMMGGCGPGGMMGMMGGWGWGYPGRGTPLTLERAVEATRQYLAAWGNPDLRLAEVMEFTGNFYAEVEEKSTGVHAFELLIDRYTGAVCPEPGPNMMWNAKYGHMVGMMGGLWGRPGGAMTVTPEQARSYAQRFLNAYLPGTTAADETDAFYGYYTIHVLRDGQVYGMLSVNGYGGQVWYHTWHGPFVGMVELE
jgi:hypothetical protein